jgi:hypothetical protein
MLIDLIHKIIDQPRAKSKRKSKPAFKPSALGSPCLRKIFYSYNRVEEDYDASVDLKKYGIGGTLAHDRISGYLRKAGVLIDYYNKSGKPAKKFGEVNLEFPLKDADLEVSAMIDAVMIIDGKLWLGEWKTIGKFPFGKLKEPKPDHLTQGAMYLYLFQKALKDGVYSHIKELDGFDKVEGVRFLYEDRDSFKLKEFVITEASEVFKQTIIKMQTVKQHTIAKQLPPGSDDWCASCSWRKKCKNNSIN